MNQEELNYDALVEAYETHRSPELFRTRETQEALDRVRILLPELCDLPKPARAEGPEKSGTLYEKQTSVQTYYEGVMEILEETVQPTPELRTELAKTLRNVIDENEGLARRALETSRNLNNQYEGKSRTYAGVKR